MILIINSGSSSIKFQLFDTSSEPFTVICKGLAERIGIDGKISVKYGNEVFNSDQQMPNHERAAAIILDILQSKGIIKNFEDIIGVGHRIVHGGETVKESVIVTDELIEVIEAHTKLAPLHNPAGLNALKAFQQVTNCEHVAVFDTTFHTTMPKLNYIYPVPYNWYEEHQVRRYGFHGISYQYITNKLSEILKKPVDSINAIICHLGNGASVCAVKGGKSYNTSMGLTPLAGLMMGTRSGDIDPSIHAYMSEQLNLDIFNITNILNKESGLLGVSTISSDIREVTTKAIAGDEQAKFTLELYTKRVVDYIVQYQNDLDNNIHALVFTAGIGENGELIREMILDKVKTMNLSYDKHINSQKYDDYLKISQDDSKVDIFAIRTNEELMICKETYELINLKD